MIWILSRREAQVSSRQTITRVFPKYSRDSLLSIMRVAVLALASGIASAARLLKKKQQKGWGVPPEDTNNTLAHCGELRIQGDEHEARGEWPLQDPRVTGAKVACVDGSDPVNPQYLVYIRSHTSASTWRDIKVYNNRAYLVSEASGHGMQVYDLFRLRGVTSTTE